VKLARISNATSASINDTGKIISLNDYSKYDIESGDNLYIWMDCDLELVPEHIWQVGDYALCPDGEIHKVRQVEGYRLDFYDYGSQSASVCTPVPEPEMPRSPQKAWDILECGWVLSPSGMRNDVNAWITFLEASKNDWPEILPWLYALSEWRKLTGRDM
jgi:hypothetical protein